MRGNATEITGCPLQDRELPIGLAKIARLSYAFKLNAFELDLNQFLALHLCLQRVQAEEEINERNTASFLSPERVFYLTYAQTGDIDKASLAKSERWLEVTRREAMRSMQGLPQ